MKSLPFILLGIGATAAGVGTAKLIKAGKDNSDANSYNGLANRVISMAKINMGTARNMANSALGTLGGKKLSVLDKSISRFIASFGKLKNVQLEDSTGMDELKQFRLDEQSAAELEKMSGNAASILGGTAAGALGGALVGFGAYSAVMAFGAASTGTAIATLSGVAATNATLAFLGGGSLAVGGLGMAGGAVVLGGLVAGPALAIMGFIIGAKASENLDNARSNYAEAQKIAEELRTAAVLCDGIRGRSNMFEQLLSRLDALFVPRVSGMEAIIAAKGDDWNKFSNKDKDTIAAAASIAKAVKTVLNIPILTVDGNLTEESSQIEEKIKPVFEAYGNAA